MIGETLGHYRIVRLLGKGGMGENFRYARVEIQFLLST